MADPETRSKVAEKRRKANRLARDVTDRKGPYKEKVYNPKKGGEYRRKKVRVGDLDDYTGDD